MISRTLGTTGLNVKAVGFGGIPIQRVEQDEVNAIIEAMIETGINFIDTARGYTVSESFIGNALSDGKRSNFVIATKSPAKDYEQMKADIETSLKNLKTDYIDLYQCHLVKEMDQYRQILSENGAYKALVEAKTAGKIRHIGITSHSVDLLNEVIDDMPFETIQFPYNIIERQAEELFKRASQRGIGVIVMKPLAGGALENGELSLKFILNNPNVSVVIPGMDKVTQVYENSNVAKMDLTLTDSEKEEIENIRTTLGETFCRRCGYCLPCVKGIDIPTQFILEGYLTRYNLKTWAIERYFAMDIKSTDCIECGECEPRCPYDLPIRKMLRNVTDQFEVHKNV
ncbi:MAG: aldo/keto reductase [Clostridiales bacterium]|nr:aldo/keto reductase [Clostridiales bacterium]